MSLPSGMPRKNRITASTAMSGAKAWAAPKTMNMIMVPRKTARRPSLSDSHPPIMAPTAAPAWVPAEVRPSSSADGWYTSPSGT